MKSTMFRNICLICLVGISVLSTSSLTTSAGNQIRIYNHAMNPRQHPDDLRRYVKPPDTNVFGNQIQFMALRDLAARSVQAAAAYRGAIRDLHEAGMSYAQIGAALGISRGTVQKHMEHGRKAVSG